MAAPRLLDAVRERVRARHYSYLTEKAYLHWTRRFIRFHGRRHPREMGKAELEAFLTSLATEARVSASTQNQALAALLFLYREVLDLPFPWLDQVVRAKPRVRAPVVLTRREVWALLGRLNGEAWLIASLLYSSGMRLLECLQTRIKDVDLEYRAITVRDGKGQKDRVVPLAEVLLAHVVAQVERTRLLFDDDRNCGRPGVSLPHALGRKYRDASTTWPWQFLFPAPALCRDPYGSGLIRHHLHPQRIQRAVKDGTGRGAPPSQSPFHRTRSDTASRRTCSKPAPIFVRCRSCSDIPTSRRR